MPKIAHTRNMLEIRHYTLNVFFGNPISNSQVKAILHGGMDEMKAGIQCRGIENVDAGLKSGSEHRSPRLLPFELPSQGNSPWRNRRKKTAEYREEQNIRKRRDVDVRNANEMRTGLDNKWRDKRGF